MTNNTNHFLAISFLLVFLFVFFLAFTQNNEQKEIFMKDCLQYEKKYECIYKWRKND